MTKSILKESDSWKRMPSREDREMSLQKFFSFERMVTPVIIQVLFVIGFLISILGGFTVVFSTLASSPDGLWIIYLFAGLILGGITTCLGILITRISTELLILNFRINETLTDIKALLEDQR